MSQAGHPDWTPAIRGYAAGLVQPATVTNLAAGATQGFNLAAVALYDVNVVQAFLPTNCMVALVPADDLGEGVPGLVALNPYAAAVSVHLPVRNEGNIVQVLLSNLTAAPVNVTWAVRGYNGIPLAELRQPPGGASSVVSGLAAGAFAPGPQLAGLGVYDRIGWAAWGLGPFDVIARLSFPQATNVVTSDLVVGSSTSGEAIGGEMAVGNPGIMLGAVNTGPNPITVEMTCRAWYDS